MRSLDGRVVLVTGGAGGIGSAVARTIVESGGRVIIHDVDDGAVDALTAVLGPAAAGLSSDLSNFQAADQLWRNAQDPHGPVDVLVNNAALATSLAVDDSLEDWVDAWNRVLAVNLVAPSILCRNAVATFSGRPGGGIIINVASVTAFRGAAADKWHYGATKGGLLALTKTIARHHGRDGVTAFAIAPGFVATPMSRPLLERGGREVVESQSPLGKVANPQDVANIVGFLATGLAEHSTGSTFDVNSGAYLR